jgi:hypothetical protein
VDDQYIETKISNEFGRGSGIINIYCSFNYCLTHVREVDVMGKEVE